MKGEDGEISVDWINNDLITFVKDRLGHDQRYAIDPTKTHVTPWAGIPKRNLKMAS